MSSRAPDRTAAIAVAALALIALGSVAAILNRDRLTGYFVHAPYRAPMLSMLKDPESAQFRDEYIMGRNLCGQVNSKNSYGAYAGFTRFISSREGFAALDGTSPSFSHQWEELCRRKER